MSTLRLLLFGFVLFAHAASVGAPIFSDDFSGGSTHWTAASGAWLAEDGKYVHKAIGENYVQSATTLFYDDFSNPDPIVTVTATPFADDFTQPDGPAAQWTPRVGTFGVNNNEYVAAGRLSTPNNADSASWTDYRIRTRVARDGAADTWGYAIVSFRLTLSGNSDSGYALLFRQDGQLNLYRRENGDFGNKIASAPLAKDNDYHDVLVQVIGPSIRVWVDKTEESAADIDVTDSTYAAGTVGMGAAGWTSRFDDFRVETLSSSPLRWSEKRPWFQIVGGEYLAYTHNGWRTLSTIADSGAAHWKDYRISTRLGNAAEVGTKPYAIIYFRASMVDPTHENAYALVFANNLLTLHTIKNGTTTPYWNPLRNGIGIPQDGDWHDVIVVVSGSMVRVWIDQAETGPPNLEYTGLHDFAEGTVGLGSTSSCRFDSVRVENILTLTASPPHLYPDTAGTLRIQSSLDLDRVRLTLTDPESRTYTIESPPGCLGSKSCTVDLKTGFPDASLETPGTYVVTASNDGDSSKLLLEVREKPALAFVQMTDLHINDTEYPLTVAQNAVRDISSQAAFPRPDFVVTTGDNTQVGSDAQLRTFKATMDALPVPYYPLLAAHDTSSEEGALRGMNWDSIFGPNRFSYTWTVGNCLFVGAGDEAPYGGFGPSMSSSMHRSWLQALLAANSGKRVFLFYHRALQQVRSSGEQRDYWLGPSSGNLRMLLEAHGGAVADFAGHAHLNGVNITNGISYLTTGSLYNNKTYRYVEVYDDRVESHIVKVDGLRYDGGSLYAQHSSDATHPSVLLYNYGLPLERQFRKEYFGKTVDFEDGMALAGNSTWSDYAFQADITLNQEDLMGENVAGLAFRYDDADNYYSVMLDSAADTVALYKKLDGVVSRLATVPLVIDTGRTYNVKVTALGSNLKVRVNDQPVIEASDGAFRSGRIGLRTYRASTEYDNVAVTDVGPPGNVEVSSVSADSSSRLTVVARTATDPDTGLGPTPYWFREISGNPGASSSSDWQTSASFVDDNLMENTKYYYQVKARDAVDNESEYSFARFRYTLADAPTGFHARGSPNGVAFSVDAFPNSSSQLSGFYFFREGGSPNSGWIRNNTWADEGAGVKIPHTYYVKYRNGDGIETPAVPMAMYAISLDSAGVPGKVVSIGDTTWVGGSDVVLTPMSSGSSALPAADMRFSNDGVNWSAWEPFAASRAWTLPEGDGGKVLYGQFREGNGNTSQTETERFMLDTTPPAGSGSINGGAEYTNNPQVTLDLSASDGANGAGVAQVRFSHDNSNWTAWETFTTSRVWTLTNGDETKAVHVQFRDMLGNATGSVSDTIILDTVAPAVSIGPPSASRTLTRPVSYIVTYDGADAVSLTSEDLDLNSTGTANGIVAVSGGGNTTRNVTISRLTGGGTLSISVRAGTATDRAGNSSPAAGPGDPVAVMLSDFDGNSRVDAFDVQLVINAALGKPVPYVCDLNGNGRADVSDVQLIINIALGRM